MREWGGKKRRKIRSEGEKESRRETSECSIPKLESFYDLIDHKKV